MSLRRPKPPIKGGSAPRRRRRRRRRYKQDFCISHSSLKTTLALI